MHFVWAIVRAMEDLAYALGPWFVCGIKGALHLDA